MAIDLTSDTTIDAGEIPRSSISGTLTTPDGQSRPDAVLLESVANGAIVTGRVLPDGSFHFNVDTTPPGRYELRLTGSFCMKSVTVKGADYSRGELEVRDGVEIQISITAAKGVSLNGVATKDGQPYGGATVLLIPQDFSHGAYIPRYQSDSDGTFTLDGVAPGNYTLLGIEDSRELAYHDPAAIAPYLKQGQMIQVPPPPGTETKVEVQRQRP
jgi:hypothetical protein